ncbi:MAG: DUF4097 family beta strand repeat-containing protein [Arachnia sp.]
MSLTHTRTETFDATSPFTFSADLRAADLTVTTVPELTLGRLTIQAAGTRAQEVADNVLVTSGNGRVEVEVPTATRFLGASTALRLRAEVPEGTTLRVSAGSGGIVADGTFTAVEARSGSGDLRVSRADKADLSAGSGNLRLTRAERAELHTGSGNIDVEDVGELRASAGSGGITVDEVRGGCEAGTGSGRIALRRFTGTGRVETGSGAVRLGDVDGDIEASTGSGSITIDRLRNGRVSTTTASGSQLISVPEGTALLVDASSVSGRVTSELDAVADGSGYGRTAEVRARAISGGITFRRA